MVHIIRRNVAGNHLARNAQTAQHGRAQRSVVEADARARGQGGVRIGHIARGRGQLGGFVVVVGDVVHHPLVDVAHHVPLVGGALGQLARLGHHGGGLVVVHEHVRHEVGRRLAGEVHVVDDAEQLHVVVARGVLHDAESVGAIAHVDGHDDGRAVAGQVVVVAHLAFDHLELQTRIASRRGAHDALGQLRGVDSALVAGLGGAFVEGDQGHRAGHGVGRPRRGALAAAVARAPRSAGTSRTS